MIPTETPETPQAQTAQRPRMKIRPRMKMTSVFLSEEDRALVQKLTAVVASTAGVATLAAVIRYALRRAAEMEETKQLAAAPSRRRAGAKKKKTVCRVPKRKNPARRRTEKR